MPIEWLGTLAAVIVFLTTAALIFLFVPVV